MVQPRTGSRLGKFMFDVDADVASAIADDIAALPAREAEAVEAGSSAELARRMDLAWGRMDPIELIAVGRALERRDELGRERRLRFARALMELGLAQEAVQTLGRAGPGD